MKFSIWKKGFIFGLIFLFIGPNTNSIIANNSEDNYEHWILESGEFRHPGLHGSAVGASGRSIVYDEFDNALYIFYFNNSVIDSPTSLCMNKIWLENNTWEGRFVFDRSKYPVGHFYGVESNDYDCHISVVATLDKENHIWVVWGGHANYNYPINCFTSTYSINSSKFNYKNENNWNLPVEIETGGASSYPKIHISKNNTYLIFMRYLNSDARCYWSFDKGENWASRKISDDFYGNHLWFYDKDDDTDKLFMYATKSNDGGTWDNYGNDFFWTTFDDILKNPGYAYASWQTTSDDPIYSFPIYASDVEESIDHIDESYSRNMYGIAFDTSTNNIYIAYTANETSKLHGVGLFSKTLGTFDDWMITEIKPFNDETALEDIEYINGSLHVLVTFKYNSKYKIRYSNSSTPRDINSWKWSDIFSTEFSTTENEIRKAFKNSDLIPFNNYNLLVFSIEFNKHKPPPNYWGSWDWIAIYYKGASFTNTPPNIPEISGPSNGIPDQKYDYTFFTKDPNGDNIRYYIEWGDGAFEWTDYLVNNRPITRKHNWSEEGIYTIKVKAKDVCFEESDIGTFEVNIPRTRATSYLLYHWFLEHFPLLEKLLDLIR